MAARQGATARNARIFLTLGVLFFLAWLYRLLTMRWTTSATLTALQFTPACLVFFLLAFRFALENYQIRMRRKVTVMEYLDRVAEAFGRADAAEHDNCPKEGAALSRVAPFL